MSDDRLGPADDPYETLRQHDQWLVQIAEHMGQLAAAGSVAARQLEENLRLIRQLIRGYEHMNQKIRYLEERIYQLENPE
jgi:dynactin complex subunit